MVSRTEAREGGAVRGEGERGSVRWGETGRERTRVAKVMAEIQRLERRGSREEGKRAQKLHVGFRQHLGSGAKERRTHRPARMGAR